MRFSTNFKLYNHKYIGLALFLFFAIMIDAFTYIFHLRRNPPQLDYLVIVLTYVTLYSVTLSYRKYLMEKKYMNPFIVCLIYGTTFCFIRVIKIK